MRKIIPEVPQEESSQPFVLPLMMFAKHCLQQTKLGKDPGDAVDGAILTAVKVSIEMWLGAK